MKFSSHNKFGFSLIEVLIGVSILAIAVVMGTQLLTSINRTNSNNLQTLQAYDLAREGLEAVRNIRDTNWLLNTDMRGDGVLYPVLEEGRYAVFLNPDGWRYSGDEILAEKADLRRLAPWDFENVDTDDVYDSDFALALTGDQGEEFVGKAKSEEKVTFYRHVDITDFCEEEECLEDAIKVRATVNWKMGTKDRSVYIDMSLTDWKGGAL